MKKRRNGGCKNSGADGAWWKRRVKERTAGEGGAAQSGGCRADRSGRNWDQRLGILTFSRWCAAGNRGAKGRVMGKDRGGIRPEKANSEMMRARSARRIAGRREKCAALPQDVP
jgi:hypothetical protein